MLLEEYACRCLEDVLYTQAAEVPLFQRLSIYVPKEYMNDDGEVVRSGQCGPYTARTAPIIFANNAAGYMQMPHTWLGGPLLYDRTAGFPDCGYDSSHALGLAVQLGLGRDIRLIGQSIPDQF